MSRIRIPHSIAATVGGALSLAVAGCVVPPPPVAYQAPAASVQQAPFVAVPGPGKTEAVFRQDDAFCRTPTALTPVAIRPGATPGAAGPAQAGMPPEDSSRLTPGVVYLQCMETRNNLIEPMQAAAPPVVYSYLQPYPVYVGPWYDYGYPWYYGSVGFGFGYGYYGYGYGFRGYGYRGFYGGYGGFRGGYGYGGFRGGYGGGYRGGFEGGYRGGFGGGYGGGGFHGGGGFRR